MAERFEFVGDDGERVIAVADGDFYLATDKIMPVGYKEAFFDIRFWTTQGATALATVTGGSFTVAGCHLPANDLSQLEVYREFANGGNVAASTVHTSTFTMPSAIGPMNKAKLTLDSIAGNATYFTAWLVRY